jgi:hypothetical protein
VILSTSHVIHKKVAAVSIRQAARSSAYRPPILNRQDYHSAYLGTVAEILTGTFLLVKENEGTENDLDVPKILKVFGQIENESLQRKYDLSKLYVPKGEIRIIVHPRGLIASP